ncbi:sensor histidine kinase [endosymbiont of Ridgeia piscesae]|jgi:signal transduction histidine kinase|uniref:sensor histidine kinase n=1 Tax=endosymbiont of Ridgeia piscesae TaxID=54398 RepID=UPI000716CD9F|nr:sensor histidine kinase [endosymbiont of Ridgeia piscesae]
MRFRASLRYRVALAFTLLGMLVSVGLAGSLYLLAIDMEARLIAETLSAELEDYMVRFEADPRALPPASTMIHTYVFLPDMMGVPEVLRELPAGLHQVHMEGKEYYAEVRLNDERHFIVLYDAEQIRHRENQFELFLGIGMLVMTLASALLGFWLARRVISPVRELAARVSMLCPEAHGAPLAGDFPHDEVGTLASEFDAYLQRLAAFIEREQSFTADVSHELRTPLAVIEGAVDVLLEDPGMDAARRSRVERIARSAHDMSELVTVLLLLAREERGDRVAEYDCAVGEMLQQVVEEHRHLLQRKSLEIKLDIQAQMSLSVACPMLRVVLANLIRNAIAYTDRGQVHVSLDGAGISVKDTGIGISEEQMQRIFDRYYTGPTGGEGIGLSLVKRICRRYGWSIDIESHEGLGTIFRLSF